MTKKETIDRLSQIKNEIYDLTHEARHILNECGNGSVAVRAKVHWISHILSALDKELDPRSGAPGVDMADTIRTLEKIAEEEAASSASRAEIRNEAITACLAARDFCGSESEAIEQVEADYDITFTKEEIDHIQNQVDTIWQESRIEAGVKTRR